MDWGLLIDGALLLLAMIGVVAIIFFIWLMVTARGTEPQEGYLSQRERDKTDAFSYLDNEVRGQFRRQHSTARGSYETGEPTLKARVDMLEKHLGIEAKVKPAQPQKVVIKKKGK